MKGDPHGCRIQSSADTGSPLKRTVRALLPAATLAGLPGSPRYRQEHPIRHDLAGGQSGTWVDADHQLLRFGAYLCAQPSDPQFH